MKPYFDDGTVSLYLGNCFEVLPELGITADAVITDCPYGETSLQWDRWQDGWPVLAATASNSMWAFGSMRMFLEHGQEFTSTGWRLSQDVIWEKPVGTSMASDRFKRVHEFALHWYRGRWDQIHHEAQRERSYGPDRGVRRGGADRGEHFGKIRSRTYADDGTRMIRSIIPVANMINRALHPTEKPLGILEPLIKYACPTGGGRG